MKKIFEVHSICSATGWHENDYDPSPENAIACFALVSVVSDSDGAFQKMVVPIKSSQLKAGIVGLEWYEVVDAVYVGPLPSEPDL